MQLSAEDSDDKLCIYDCAYCINRASSCVQRARYSVEEVARLTVDSARRNCIEGLFLQSGIIRSPDDTTADRVRIAQTPREKENFRGYIDHPDGSGRV